METTCDVWTGGIIGEPQRLDVVRSECEFNRLPDTDRDQSRRTASLIQVRGKFLLLYNVM